jgi:hypothetical protein
MAAVRSKAQIPVGSARWVYDEREQVAQFGDQDAEDFAFSARNEVEWLNEHMAEIFGSNQLYGVHHALCFDILTSCSNVTEIFKTPGKLRGKTPRTARKRNPLEARAVCIPACFLRSRLTQSLATYRLVFCRQEI